jgi:hypothetical protein
VTRPDPEAWEARKRWKPGYADRAISMCESAGLDLTPWMCEFLRQMERADINEEFTEIVSSLRYSDDTS